MTSYNTKTSVLKSIRIPRDLLKRIPKRTPFSKFVTDAIREKLERT